MPLVITTEPTALAVSLDEAKTHCRITEDNHDNYLLSLLAASTSAIQTLTGSLLGSQSVRLDLDGFPVGAIDLGAYPVTAVTAIAYDDADNVEQTLVLGTDYWERLSGMYPQVWPITAWPVAKLYKPASVRITMTAGYATTPADLKHAILVQVKELFDNGGDSITGIHVTPTNTIKALTDMHRRMPI